jgi:hypothetical protein
MAIKVALSIYANKGIFLNGAIYLTVEAIRENNI